MRKALLILLFVCAAVGAHAQRSPHALGVHFGGATADIEYQYHFSKQNFLDVTLGLFDLDDGPVLQGIYNWNIHQWPNWTPNFATWKFWGGFGGGIGFYDQKDDNGLFLGPVGTLGFGFTIKDVPLTFGIDYRPMVAVKIGDESGLLGTGFHNLGVTFTYRF